jgi:preprotein translocase subunit SecA
MRIFGGDRLKGAMQKFGMEENVPIESGMVSRAIERAQKQVEQRNFETRKHLLEYDDVNNKQRQEIYGLRRDLLEGKNQKEYMIDKGREIFAVLMDDYIGSKKDVRDWEVEPFRQQLQYFFGYDPEKDGLHVSTMTVESVNESIWTRLEERYDEKEKKVGADLMRQYERHILLQIIDHAWKDHLLAMDHLKDGIGLRAYGQKDPLVEYKRESFDMFGMMRERIENDAVRFLFLLEPMTDDDRQREEEKRRREQEQVFRAASQSAAGVTAKGGIEQVARKEAKVGRNDLCPCGSGKKYKKCHGENAA